MHYTRLGGKGLSGIDVHNGFAQRIRRCSLLRLRLHASVLALPLHSSRFLPTPSLTLTPVCPPPLLRLYPRTLLGRARREAASFAQ